MITRRSILGALAAGAAGRLALSQAWAAAAEYRALVCVFLFGGNDSNNTVVPLTQGGYSGYAAARGASLSLAQNVLLPVTAKSGGAYGLHPRLTDLQRLFNAGRAAIVANVGVLARPTTREEYRNRAVPLPTSLFSHSDQQTEWQNGIADVVSTTGWGGRAGDRLASNNTEPSLTGVSLAGNTIFLAGEKFQASLVTTGAQAGLSGFGTGADSQARLLAFEQLLGMTEGSLLGLASARITAEGMRISRLLSGVLGGASPFKTVFPATTLARQLEQVARLMRARDQFGVSRQVFFCSLGGFDTHVSQLATHDALLLQLGPALAALHDATEEMGIARQVVTFTESDFGRTLGPNANAGSDHGWGGHHFVVGGAVRGGDVYGQFPSVSLNGPDDATGRGVWVPTTSVDQYAATLASWLGVPEAELPGVLPNLAHFPVKNLGFV
jgi:uncharacterized protein (DUF1501 family)